MATVNPSGNYRMNGKFDFHILQRVYGSSILLGKEKKNYKTLDLIKN